MGRHAQFISEQAFKINSQLVRPRTLEEICLSSEKDNRSLWVMFLNYLYIHDTTATAVSLCPWQVRNTTQRAGEGRLKWTEDLTMCYHEVFPPKQGQTHSLWTEAIPPHTEFLSTVKCFYRIFQTILRCIFSTLWTMHLIQRGGFSVTFSSSDRGRLCTKCKNETAGNYG